MLQMVGNNDLAMQYYFDYDNVEKPQLSNSLNITIRINISKGASK